MSAPDSGVESGNNSTIPNKTTSTNASITVEVKHIPFEEFERVPNVKNIGAGGYGSVSLYTHKPTNEKRAIKTILKNAEHFENEIKPMLKLRHENIVRCYGITENVTFKAIVMEFMSGGNLKEVIEEEGFDYSVADILRWSIQSASVLEYMHNYESDNQTEPESKFLHRDIKPHNMLLNTNRKFLKICDFGTAKQSDTSGNTSRIGTSLYIAPEVIRSSRYNNSCDVYSWAVSFWECFTRTIPFGFQKGVLNAVIDHKKSTEKVSLGKIENASTKFNQIIQSCSNFDQKYRLPIRPVKSLLEHLLENSKKMESFDTKSGEDNIWIWCKKDNLLYYCDELDFENWKNFYSQLNEIRTELEELARPENKGSETALWTITKDFDIYFCNALTEEWTSNYTSFFQLSLFQNQFGFKVCGSFQNKIYFFITNKNKEFEEMISYDTKNEKIDKEQGLTTSFEQMTSAQFRHIGNEYLLVADTKIKQELVELQLYDFGEKRWMSVCGYKSVKNTLNQLQLVRCRDGAMAFFMNDSGDENEVQLFNKSLKKWEKIEKLSSKLENNYKSSNTKLSYHDGHVYVYDGTNCERFISKKKEWEKFSLPEASREKAIKLVSLRNELHIFIDNGNGYDVEKFEETGWTRLNRSVPLNVAGSEFVAI